MTLLHVVLRGIRYRPGRSVVVLALAAVATAAAVMTPAYTSAAHQSLLTDELTDLPPGFDRARVAAEGHRAKPDAEHFDDIYESIDAKVSGSQELSPLVDPVRYVSTNVSVSKVDWPAFSQVIYREGLCERLRMVEGKCTTGKGEVLISKRSAAFEDAEVGDTIELGTRRVAEAGTAEVTIAGIYTPRDASSDYWGLVNPFAHAIGPDDYNLDALFMTDPESTTAVGRPVEVGVEYTLDIPAIRLANVGQLKAELATIDKSGSFAGRTATTESRISGVLKDVAQYEASVAASVPLVTIPLLVLSWFVLYLVVARLSEERGPQIALAKLRGHRFTAVTGFGTGEAMVLIVAGAPVGALLGWLLVQTVAWQALAKDAAPTLTVDIVVYVAVSLLGAWAAALAAARPVLNRPVLTLLRRVPARGNWRAGLLEGALVALAAVAVWQVLSASDAGAIGLLATPLVAVVVGVAVARLLEQLARRRLPVALRKAKLARMLALAQVSRRPETRRMVVLVTVAAAVVTFGVCAWDVSEHNRELTASDEIGADRVYTLSAGDPQTVMDTVEKLDPEGDELMAAMRRVDRYDNQDFSTIAVQSDRLSKVASWRDMSPARLGDLAGQLHPRRPEPLRVKEEISVKADVDDFDAARKPSLVAKVVPDGADPVLLRLGNLSKGSDTYEVSAPECDDGCRLIGVGVSPHPADFEGLSAKLTVSEISDADGEVDASLSECDNWQPIGDLPADTPLELDCSEGLRISVDSDDSHDFLAEYASNPLVLPAAVAGSIPAAEVDGDEFASMGPQRDLQRYQRVQAVTVVPRGGVRAMMVDLEYTNLAAQNYTAIKDQEEVTFEVWANAAADPDLAARLAEEGLVVKASESRDTLLERMSRSGPALSLRLYLVAAILALLLVIGAVLLSSTVGAAVRGYDNAALAVSGVTRRQLRAASIREHLYWIVFPAAAGIGAGFAGLALVLPSVPLVSDEAPEVAMAYELRPLLPGGALALMACAFAALVWLAVRLGRRRGSARRLRDSVS
ncbi:FtsX-like permease family protein [Stackebrandtia nassauensis]|nr:FtsX-like permease family protein [Stackebrandtia nassauensis]